MLGQNHFVESNWHVLTFFFHPKFDVQCSAPMEFSSEQFLTLFLDLEKPKKSQRTRRQLFTKELFTNLGWDLLSGSGRFCSAYEWGMFISLL
jgi:hypothetical protein